ncbi:Protein TIC 20-I, chloroplastic [Zostera marina]|uniref:Protein TIC 20 n=1 Tax=Zostera marina TaxID=29655 RepID=A0A0K9PAM4_ZOSMR|nr:Protein TIC 20-I, chloroplastic [Zostera marina]
MTRLLALPGPLILNNGDSGVSRRFLSESLPQKHYTVCMNSGGKSVSQHFTSVTSSFKGRYESITSFPIRTPVRRSKIQHPFMAKAKSDVPLAKFLFPPMTKKPKWFWRTLSCIPYLIPLHESWMYAETAYQLHPYLKTFELLTIPFHQFLSMQPPWFMTAYFLLLYLGIARRKIWPHFFRFHVATGMLLEISLQVLGYVSHWMPHSIYWGKIGMHFWSMTFFGFVFTVFECVRCALSGMYADIPFVCDAAYIQINDQ